MTQQEFSNFMNDLMKDDNLLDKVADLTNAYLSNGLESFGITQEKIEQSEKIKTILNDFIAKGGYNVPEDIQEQVRGFLAKNVFEAIRTMQRREIQRIVDRKVKNA